LLLSSGKPFWSIYDSKRPQLDWGSRESHSMFVYRSLWIPVFTGMTGQLRTRQKKTLKEGDK